MASPDTKLAGPGRQNRRGAGRSLDDSTPALTYEPETPLGRRLMKIHEEIVASGQPLIDTWEELEREIAERRGGQFDRS